MLQFGIVGLILAIPAFIDGNYAGGLLCVFAGLFFISTRKVPVDTKVTLASFMKPAYDGNGLSFFDQIARIASYLALAAAIVIWAMKFLPHLS